MPGLSFIGDFTASRVLDIQLEHVLAAQMNYLGIYGESLENSSINTAPGSSPTPVSATGAANAVFGSNYFTANLVSTASGFYSTNQPQQLDETIFIAFSAGAAEWTSGTAFTSPVISIWGDPASGDPSRMSLVLYKTADGVPYIVLRWGIASAVPIMTCAIALDWTTVVGPILAMASRDGAGKMLLEVRAGGTTYQATGTAVPPESVPTSANWRAYVGNNATFHVSNLRTYAAAVWSAAMSTEQISAELDVMRVNLSSHLA